METLVALITVIIYLALIVLGGFFIYWQIRFLTQVPRFLNRIAEALEQLANK